ncbi:MAG: hypothetical protein QXX56_04210 [Candidatus Bathyarchaeia archaeon]
MAHIRLRDRDAIITPEGLIFRVLGYSHPSNGYICDVEYAPSEIYRSSNPKASEAMERQSSTSFMGMRDGDYYRKDILSTCWIIGL